MIPLSVNIFACNFWEPIYGAIFVNGWVYKIAPSKVLVNGLNHWVKSQWVKEKPLHKKCLYSELFRSGFSRIRTKYEEMRSISFYSARMRESVDQNNSGYGYLYLPFLNVVVYITNQKTFLKTISVIQCTPN